MYSAQQMAFANAVRSRTAMPFSSGGEGSAAQASRSTEDFVDEDVLENPERVALSKSLE